MPIREMTLADYDAVMALLGVTAGVCLRDADSPAAVARFLARNPGLSLVLEEAGQVRGCLMAGHDGRRGYLYHLAVAETARRQGHGRALVCACLARLAADGIHKCHLEVLSDNQPAHAFWQALGWQRRGDIVRYSYSASPEA